MRTATWTAAVLVGAGVSAMLFPVLRPWPDETRESVGLAAAFASDRWVVSHLLGILALALVPVGLLGLRRLLAATPGRPSLTWALALSWAGAGLAALYYGAETFGIQVIARHAAQGDASGHLEQVEALRTHPVAATLFGVGLVLVAVAGVLTAVGTWRGGLDPRWAGVPLAVALVLVLPQFWGGPGVRVAHGVLVALAAALLAVAVLRLSARGTPGGRAG
ncbi:hypothetical protein [Oerskovia flava]|uniref:hypothetical protein n=1 Tax=Oerskovia flava TaxID=2986422 RepID=UPI00223EF757|nr:hypothetical protein [Oerskovia sp. JB1-3-2]